MGHVNNVIKSGHVLTSRLQASQLMNHEIMSPTHANALSGPAPGPTTGTACTRTHSVSPSLTSLFSPAYALLLALSSRAAATQVSMPYPARMIKRRYRGSASHPLVCTRPHLHVRELFTPAPHARSLHTVCPKTKHIYIYIYSDLPTPPWWPAAAIATRAACTPAHSHPSPSVHCPHRSSLRHTPCCPACAALQASSMSIGTTQARDPIIAPPRRPHIPLLAGQWHGQRQPRTVRPVLKLCG